MAIREPISQSFQIIEIEPILAAKHKLLVKVAQRLSFLALCVFRSKYFSIHFKEQL